MEDRNECDKPCGMNYCDENGCTNRKRDLVDLVDVIKDNTESDAVEFADWLIATRWVKVINGIGYYTSKELYELFKQSKTNPPTGIKQ